MTQIASSTFIDLLQVLRRQDWQDPRQHHISAPVDDETPLSSQTSRRSDAFVFLAGFS